jgi:hypothetical protein
VLLKHLGGESKLLLNFTMADAAPAAASEESLANLHLDEVTGEKVSKPELKKR